MANLAPVGKSGFTFAVLTVLLYPAGVWYLWGAVIGLLSIITLYLAVTTLSWLGVGIVYAITLIAGAITLNKS